MNVMRFVCSEKLVPLQESLLQFAQWIDDFAPADPTTLRSKIPLKFLTRVLFSETHGVTFLSHRQIFFAILSQESVCHFDRSALLVAAMDVGLSKRLRCVRIP